MISEGGGGWCPPYNAIISERGWGNNIIKNPAAYKSDQLVKEEDIIVDTDKFIVNTSSGEVYLVGSGTYAKIPMQGVNDFLYIAGRDGHVGMLSFQSGLYILNTDLQWEHLYTDSGSNQYAHLARYNNGWIFYKAKGGTNYIIKVSDDGMVSQREVPGIIYSISVDPTTDYCLVGMYYQGGACTYTFLSTLINIPSAYATVGMFTPELVIQGLHNQPRGIVYSISSNHTYYSNDPGGTTWVAAKVKPQLSTISKGLYVNCEFIIVGGTMKSVSRDGGRKWTTSTLGEYFLDDLIYDNSNWYAIGGSYDKKFLLKNTASTFDQSNKVLDLPDYSRQIVKF